jgi:dinuclear metal center YbgI/SA1388 family protein
MTTVSEIEQALFRLAPKEGAMDWDNVGHLLGDPQQPVEQVLVALDITEAVADEAIEKKCQLIVSHHPVMNCKWLPVQTVRDDTPQGHLLLKLLRNGVSAICMHTNLDVAVGGVNDCLAEALELENIQLLGDPEGLCRQGTLPSEIPLQDFVSQVSKALNCNGVRFADAGKPVCRVAVGGGACGEYEDAAIAAGCDTFVTSDLSYHQFLDAAGKGINLIDAGHFPTEDPVCNQLISFLTAQFPELTVSKSTSHREVIQYYVEGEINHVRTF